MGRHMTFKVLSTVTVKRNDSDGRDSSVSIVTTGWTVLYSNPGGRKGLYFIKNLQFDSEAHTAPPPTPTPHSTGTGFHSWGVMKFTVWL